MIESDAALLVRKIGIVGVWAGGLRMSVWL